MKAAALLDFVPFRVFTAHASDPNPALPEGNDPPRLSAQRRKKGPRDPLSQVKLSGAQYENRPASSVASSPVRASLDHLSATVILPQPFDLKRT